MNECNYSSYRCNFFVSDLFEFERVRAKIKRIKNDGYSTQRDFIENI